MSDNISIVFQNKSLDMESQLNNNRNNIINNNIGNYNGEIVIVYLIKMN